MIQKVSKSFHPKKEIERYLKQQQWELVSEIVEMNGVYEVSVFSADYPRPFDVHLDIHSCRNGQESELVRFLKHEAEVLGTVQSDYLRRTQLFESSRQQNRYVIDALMFTNVHESTLVQALKVPQHMLPEHVSMVLFGVLCAVQALHDSGWAGADARISNILVLHDGRPIFKSVRSVQSYTPALGYQDKEACFLLARELISSCHSARLQTVLQILWSGLSKKSCGEVAQDLIQHVAPAALVQDQKRVERLAQETIDQSLEREQVGVTKKYYEALYRAVLNKIFFLLGVIKGRPKLGIVLAIPAVIVILVMMIFPSGDELETRDARCESIFVVAGA